jgi:probable ATP-dependent RNA helicase DDX4
LDAEEELKIGQGINFDRFDKIEVDVRGGSIKPINTFSDLITSQLLLDNIKRAGYTKMTPIQRYTIPAMAANHDIVGCAQTGSGKTAAFLLPVLQTILNLKDLDSAYGQECQKPYCIVIAPTRELARQTYVEALKLSRDSVIKCQCIYGGTQTGYLRAQISKGTHILVATPGRLKDFIGRNWISLENVKYVILDEGDRLIDDGFVVDMRAMFTHPLMPSKSERQTLFFSATFKEEAQSVAREFMKPDYLFITVGMVGAANEDVKQEFIQVERAKKKRELLQILQNNPDDKVIVFTQTKATADIISSYLTSMGVQCTSIHGDRHQSQREEALSQFKRGLRRCLVASPVGERGLDLPKVSMVINYDMPNELDEYIHRIGRTGRIGNTGRAISFFDPDRDTKLINDLTRALKQAQQEVPDFFSGGFGQSANYGMAESFDKENSSMQNGPEPVSGGDAGVDDEW